MIDIAKIQSTKSSNAIEGIFTSDTRLKELMSELLTTNTLRVLELRAS